MANPEVSPSIVQLKVRLLGISPMIWRAGSGAGIRVAARTARHPPGKYGLGGYSSLLSHLQNSDSTSRVKLTDFDSWSFWL